MVSEGKTGALRSSPCVCVCRSLSLSPSPCSSPRRPRTLHKHHLEPPLFVYPTVCMPVLPLCLLSGWTTCTEAESLCHGNIFKTHLLSGVVVYEAAEVSCIPFSLVGNLPLSATSTAASSSLSLLSLSPSISGRALGTSACLDVCVRWNLEFWVPITHRAFSFGSIREEIGIAGLLPTHPPHKIPVGGERETCDARWSGGPCTATKERCKRRHNASPTDSPTCTRRDANHRTLKPLDTHGVDAEVNSRLTITLQRAPQRRRPVCLGAWNSGGLSSAW